MHELVNELQFPLHEVHIVLQLLNEEGSYLDPIQLIKYAITVVQFEDDEEVVGGDSLLEG